MPEQKTFAQKNLEQKRKENMRKSLQKMVQVTEQSEPANNNDNDNNNVEEIDQNLLE